MLVWCPNSLLSDAMCKLTTHTHTLSKVMVSLLTYIAYITSFTKLLFLNTSFLM